MSTRTGNHGLRPDIDGAYARSFASFLRSTDEKRGLGEKISSIIEARKVRRLLDVGAGEGTLARMLRPHVSDYLAVESLHEHALALRRQGLEVIERAWPLDPGRKFDLVLMSYVLSPQSDLGATLTAARQALTVDGAVVVVCHDVPDRSWQRLLARVGVERHAATDLPDRIEHLLRCLGLEVMRTAAASCVRTESLKAACEALAFVFKSEGLEPLPLGWDQAVASEVRPNQGCFEFPFHHRLIIANEPTCT